mgnify:CR=1 FL=1
MNDLILEAQLRYPIGTKYYNLNLIGEKSCPNDLDDQPTIPNNVSFEFSCKSADGKPVILVRNNESIFGWVYSNGIWAEIISKPINKNQIITNYSIF